MKKEKDPKGKERFILIRELTEKDRSALAFLRKEFNTTFNTRAVLSAMHSYQVHQKEIESLRKQKAVLERSLSKTKDELVRTKQSIKNYFDFQKNVVSGIKSYLTKSAGSVSQGLDKIISDIKKRSR